MIRGIYGRHKGPLFRGNLPMRRLNIVFFFLKDEKMIALNVMSSLSKFVFSCCSLRVNT